MPNTPTFDMIEVAPGRRLHCTVEGPLDAPFVLYDAGAFGLYADGWWIKEALKDRFRVCLYDRAGLGASDPVPENTSPTPAFHVDDMRRLVAALGVTDPFTLIGHSMAGLRLHSFANLYPDELQGLVFVDALSPRNFKATSGRFAQDQFGNLLKLGAFGAKLGLAERVAGFAPNNFNLSGQQRDDKVWAYAAPEHHNGSRDEVLALDYDAAYLHGDGATQLPMAIFAATYINGMKPEDAKRAEEATGYGWYGKFPREDHVSILLGVYADAIASRVDEIAAKPGLIAGRAAAL